MNQRELKILKEDLKKCLEDEKKIYDSNLEKDSRESIDLFEQMSKKLESRKDGTESELKKFGIKYTNEMRIQDIKKLENGIKEKFEILKKPEKYFLSIDEDIAQLKKLR